MLLEGNQGHKQYTVEVNTLCQEGDVPGVIL